MLVKLRVLVGLGFGALLLVSEQSLTTHFEESHSLFSLPFLLFLTSLPSLR